MQLVGDFAIGHGVASQIHDLIADTGRSEHDLGGQHADVIRRRQRDCGVEGAKGMDSIVL
ncbi:hypothetical protein D3C78_1908300 [compost metagenome]